jgi:prolipoprotein diacylglyceryl transferase
MIHWNIAPEMISVGPFTVRWYGALFATSFFLGYRHCAGIFEAWKLPQRALDRLFLHVFLGTLVGARVGHCLFYEPSIYLREPWRIPMIWEGGLASHGAAVGIILSLLWYGKREPKLGALWGLDCIAVPIALSGALIRLGNFFNSEILGKPSEMPWSVVFERVDAVPRHPAQLYESFTYLVIWFILKAVARKPWAKIGGGALFGSFLALIFGTRFFLEFFKENQVGFEQDLALNMGQMLSFPLVMFGAWLVLRAKKN